MGAPKLLLPVRGVRLIDRVLHAWTSSRVDQTVVVVRSDDHELAEVCRQHSVSVVRPETDPEDMKESVRCGLRHLETKWAPDSRDVFFISPADLPTLSVEIIDRLLSVVADEHPALREHQEMIVPVFDDKIGHPILLPWSMRNAVFRLADDEGIDQLVKRRDYRAVSVPERLRAKDVDTPQDYERLLEKDGRDPG